MDLDSPAVFPRQLKKAIKELYISPAKAYLKEVMKLVKESLTCRLYHRLDDSPLLLVRLQTKT
jgi:hypothetical protein